MQPETMSQPVALPRDAKPSEILESQPRERWCQGGLHETLSDGTERYCRVGWLALHAGWYGLSDDRNAELKAIGILDVYDFVHDHYSLPRRLVVVQLPETNDMRSDGYDATLELMQQAGY